MSGTLEKVFHLRASGTNVRTEMTADIVTFMAMACIVFVHPAIITSAVDIPGADPACVLAVFFILRCVYLPIL